LKRFCDALDRGSHEEVLHMAKTLAQAVIVAHPAAVRVLILSGIRGSGHYDAMAREMQAGAAAPKANENGPAEARP
jgi:hypothetical protein